MPEGHSIVRVWFAFGSLGQNQKSKHQVIKQREHQVNYDFCVLLMFTFQYSEVRRQTEVNVKRMQSEKVKFYIL